MTFRRRRAAHLMDGAFRAAAMSVIFIVLLLASSDAGFDIRTWAWLLTGLQVLAMWAAGSGRTSGWLLGASVQPVWIAYALMTHQGGFVIGCLISAAVQLSNYAPNTSRSRPEG